MHKCCSLSNEAIVSALRQRFLKYGYLLLQEFDENRKMTAATTNVYLDKMGFYGATGLHSSNVHE
jgi:hypothetical protein